MKKMMFVLMFAVIPMTAQTPYDSLYLKSSLYKNRTAMFAQTNASSAKIVFFGNSITSGGDWNTLLDRDSIVNQGIVGDNTVGMLHRLRYVYQLQPKLCFVMAGINDIYADAPVETIFSNYKKIIDTLRSKNITLIIQSTLHVNPKWKRTEVKNPEVKKLNDLLSEYCAVNKIMFVDVNAKLSTNGVLNDRYTTDGVHLSPAAYGAWSKLIVPILREFGL
ncbi:MAG: GDSL-type esterase/lipase family protein [Bacteroidota bacterium]|nr:GDSL-type esterase/lipase family protein [Bacteroidota bacterium]